MIASLTLAFSVALIAFLLRDDFRQVRKVRDSTCAVVQTVCTKTTAESAKNLSDVAREGVARKRTSKRHFPADVVGITRELVAIPSETGSEHTAGAYVAEWLMSRGWQVSKPVAEGKRFNVLAFPQGLQHVSMARVVLSTHFDTVPKGKGTPRIDQGRVYGRGAVDAKGILASMLVAGQMLSSRSAAIPLALLFVCGEEKGHAGMIAANDHGLSPTVAIVNGEPTTGKLCVSQKGILKVVLEAKGKACHSGYPELGSSAIEFLLDVLGDLRARTWKKDPESGAEVTMNIGLISGGSAANVVPASASATIAFRTVSSGENVLEEVKQIVAEHAQVSIGDVSQNPPMTMYAPKRSAQRFGTYTAAYNTDLAYFKRAGKKVLFGGGTIANAHVEDEYIEISELNAMPGQYEAIVQELLQESETEQRSVPHHNDQRQ